MKNIRSDFPILSLKVDNHPLIYLDNAATSQKPEVVIEAVSNFYASQNANTARGIVYALGEQATTLYEESRARVALFLNALPEEIVFTRGATDGINAIAFSYGIDNLKTGDEILLTEMEHHSNLIPWQQVAMRVGAQLKFIPVLPDGTLDLSTLDRLITKKTKIISIVHVSNALGTHNPIEQITKAGKSVSAVVMIDATQSVPHQKVDVKKIGCDFLTFSGHKVMGPTGIGVLYINKKLHEHIQPYQFGGGMIYEADFHKATFLKMPHKFEAGTTSAAQAVGLKVAIDYIEKNVPFLQLIEHEAKLCSSIIDGLSSIKKIKLIGPLEQLKKKGHLITFTVDGIHPHDVAAHLGKFGICVRAGNYCAQPLMKKMGIISSVRASFYAYNTQEEVDTFLEVIETLIKK